MSAPNTPQEEAEPEYPPGWKKKAIPKHLKPQQKFNSTSSLYIDSTISKPKDAELVHCIAIYLSKIITPIDSSWNSSSLQNPVEIFDETRHPLTSKNVDVKQPPSVETIEKLVKAIFKVGQLAPESLVMGVAYFGRSVQQAKVKVFPHLWRRLLLSCLILASKVWEDQAVWNVDFIDLFPLTTPHDLGQLEKRLLAFLGFDVSLKASEYAKIYFDLRALAATGGGQFTELEPLSRDGEGLLEVRSQKFTETHAKKLFRSSGSVDNIGKSRSPRTILN